jgi:hypothetical protein
VTARKPRRIPRAVTRGEFWAKMINGAPSGREALDALLDYARGELRHVERARPQEADGIRRHLARKWLADVLALSTAHAPRSRDHAAQPPQPPKRPRPLQPADGRGMHAEPIARPEGPLRNLRGGQRFPRRQP